MQNNIGGYAGVTFAPPAGEPLIPGTYNDAQRTGDQDPGEPALDVSYGDEGCNTVEGRFIVDEASYDADGNVVSFAARFEAHCEGAAGAIFGFVSYNSSVAYPTRTVSTNSLTFTTTGAPVAQAVTLTNYGPAVDSFTGFSISGLDASSFGISDNSCTSTLAVGASCSVSVTYAPEAEPDTSTATLYVTDTLAPAGPPDEPAGAGEGRAIELTGTSSPPVQCLFNGTNDETPVANVMPGSSISIDCTGFEPLETIAAGEASPLYLTSLDPSDLDTNVQFFTTDASGNLNASFAVPDPFVATDPNAVCPPTATEVSEGYLECLLIIADQYGAGDVVPLDYAPPPPPPPTPPLVTTAGQSKGYWMVGSDGGVFAFGNAPYLGSLPGLGVHLNDIRAVVPTADGKGYWMIGADGGVFAFGDAPYVGSLPGIHVHVSNIVAVVPTADGKGYWMIGSDGGVFAFGDAPYLGSLPGLGVHLNDIRAVVPTADGKGYWMIGADGGVFAFGDAPYVGSLPGIHVHVDNIVGVVPDSDGKGYWMIGSDGGVFAFGDAPYLGSLPGLGVHVNDIRAVVPTADGKGYWMIGADGGVFAFGDAPYVGSLPGIHVHVDNIVGVVPD